MSRNPKNPRSAESETVVSDEAVVFQEVPPLGEPFKVIPVLTADEVELLHGDISVRAQLIHSDKMTRLLELGYVDDTAHLTAGGEAVRDMVDLRLQDGLPLKEAIFAATEKLARRALQDVPHAEV